MNDINDLMLGGQAAAGEPIEALTREGPAIPLARPDRDLDAHTRKTLAQMEREIGQKYGAHNVRTWPYVAIALICFAVFVATFPLAIMGVIPLWLGCAINSVFVAGGYVVSHEAMHSNLGREGTRQRFWNELTGWIAAVPLILPFSMLKAMHLLHHQYTNDPDKDPDAIHSASNVFMAVIKSWLNRQPGAGGTAARWRRHIGELGTPEAKAALKHTMAIQLVVLSFFFAMAWQGYAIEVALLWWLPRHIGLSYIHAVLSWAPHQPHSGVGRYDSTAIIRHKLGHWGALGIDFHLVHHLHPYIPVHACKAAYREMKPILEARGVDCSAH
ncbi:fatty acid desaturase [Novosphingobium sp. PS1R-30]|uniref:Fatty acid desaturase n=1 Tax=Novosphingobium anseongense TaxID=3133436 RepID=A0ABU8RQZ7_9SPHN